MIRVAVVDDHPHVAIALRALLDETPDIRLVAESRRGSDVAALVRRAQPNVLLLDLFIEPEFDALSTVRRLRADFPNLKICLLCAYIEPSLVRNLLQAGVYGYILKDDDYVSRIDTDDLCLPVSHAAVRWVASGGEAQRANRGRLRELIAQGRADLAWTQAWVPLMRGADLRGLWLLGTREEKKPYAPQDLGWLTTIGRQAAAVLETTRCAEQERRTASEMRALYHQVVTAREEERGRLARELHDGVLQDLCAVTRDLKALEAQPESIGAPFTDLADRAGKTVHSLRAICNDLRPPLLQSDLASALEALVDELDKRSVAPIHVEISTQDLRVPDDVALVIFRITQEALHNAIQHADASEIAVHLTEYPDRLRLTVTDDGRGIQGGVEPARFVAQGHFGLAGMRERAAMIDSKLDVQKAIDYGTAVILELPH